MYGRSCASLRPRHTFHPEHKRRLAANQSIARQLTGMGSWPRSPLGDPLLRAAHAVGLTGHPVLSGLESVSRRFLPYRLLGFGAVLNVAHTGNPPGLFVGATFRSRLRPGMSLSAGIQVFQAETLHNRDVV